MKTHAILLLSIALALCGCATDDARLREHDGALREAVRDAWARAAEADQGEVAPSSDGEVSSGEAAATLVPTATSDEAAAAPFASLKWPWGGFAGCALP